MKAKMLLMLLSATQLIMGQKQISMKSIVNIDMGKETGIIRPLHGGNLGPVSDHRFVDFSDFFIETKVPITRLHDVSFFNKYAVDITTIFRDFRDDPSNADNYDFRQTDDYLATIIKTGAKIVYRLGETYEPRKNKYNVHPPPDNDKWAAICSGIIRHYNEGWANGFHYDIKYWEIWNEPDETRKEGWTGTDEQFFRFYEVAAKTIKKNFPALKVGGPSLSSSLDEKTKGAASFQGRFLDYCRNNSVPLDFLSWHYYAGEPWTISHTPTYVRAILDKYGFPNTESHLNEWNYVPGGTFKEEHIQGDPRTWWFEQQSSIKGGAFIVDVFMLLQDEPIDVSNLYTITNGGFGLYSDFGVPYKSLYAYKAFADLVNNTPVRIETQYNKADSLVICSGTNKEKTELAVLVSNFTDRQGKVEFNLANNFLRGPVKYELYAVDATHNLSKIKVTVLKGDKTFRITENIAGPSVYLLKLFSAGNSLSGK